MRSSTKKDSTPRIEKEQDDGLKYLIVSGKGLHSELSKKFRRDVLSERVQMKKKYIIAYNVVETKE